MALLLGLLNKISPVPTLYCWFSSLHFFIYFFALFCCGSFYVLGGFKKKTGVCGARVVQPRMAVSLGAQAVVPEGDVGRWKCTSGRSVCVLRPQCVGEAVLRGQHSHDSESCIFLADWCMRVSFVRSELVENALLGDKVHYFPCLFHMTTGRVSIFYVDMCACVRSQQRFVWKAHILMYNSASSRTRWMVRFLINSLFIFFVSIPVYVLAVINLKQTLLWVEWLTVQKILYKIQKNILQKLHPYYILTYFAQQQVAAGLLTEEDVRVKWRWGCVGGSVK